MRRFLLGMAAGVLLATLAAPGGLWLWWRWRQRPPTVAAHSILTLELSGLITEAPPPAHPFSTPRGPSTTFEIWQTLRRAADDTRIRALWLAIGPLDAGWAKLAEIRGAVDTFRRSGKPVTAYLRQPSTREYLVASAASRVVMPPGELLDFKGLRAEIAYLGGTLEKAGVRAEIEHAGRYKDAGDVLTRTGMRPETAEVVNDMLDARYGAVIGTVAAARRISAAEVRRLAGEGPYLAEQALERNLIDAVEFDDQARANLARKLGQEKIVETAASQYRLLQEDGFEIALLAAEGDILRDGPSWLAPRVLAADAFRRRIRDLADDPRYGAVLLRIDSPGGDAIASDEILHELEVLSRRKPLVVSMSDVAASGGYAIALAGGPVVAYPETVTGSIGVLYGKFDLRGLYAKLGVHHEILTRGQNAGIDSTVLPLTESGRVKLREGLNHTYRRFLLQVANARRRPESEIEAAAGGRAWLGSQALSLHLVDELGGFDRAIALVKARARIPGAKPVRVTAIPRPGGFAEALLEEGLRQLLRLPPGRGAALSAAGPHGGLRKQMPYWIEIR